VFRLFLLETKMEMQLIINDLGIPLWPLGILFLLGVLVLLRSRKHSFAYLFFFSLFWLYAMAGLDKTFFPLQVNGLFVDVMRQQPLFSLVNLVPLHFSEYGLSAAGYLGLLYNILLTVPLGCGANFLRRLRLKDTLGLSIAVGFGIEGMQLVMTLVLRYPYRVVDINDALLNALGVWIGYGVFRFLAWLALKVAPTPKVERRGSLDYLSTVLDRSSEGTIR
jgi:glycopeptide antibiotics resistance protein